MMRRSVFCISITPFDDEGRVDDAALRAHLDRLAVAGVGVYLGGGGSGEGFTLDDDEARRVLDVGVEAVAGRVPVRAMGIEPRTAAQMVQYLELAAAAGVDAAQVYSLEPGHGHRPSPAEVERYLLEVLSSTSLPCVVSTHQSVGYRIAPALLESLAGRFDHLVGVNCTHQDLGFLAELVDRVAGRLEVHVGGPNQGLTAMALGAQGFLTSEANLAPRLCAAVVRGAEEDDLQGTFAAHADVVRLSALLYGHGGIRATKAVLNRLGLPGGQVRPPQELAPEAAVDAILQRLGTMGLGPLEGWGR